MADDVTRDAANPGFNYYGRWQHGNHLPLAGNPPPV
jgi:hypothetical protein